MRTLSSGFFSLVLLLCLSSTLLAQTFRGGIQGTVTDATGAVVAGADVTVANPETGFSRATRTDATGNYFVSELPIGNYDVTVKEALSSRDHQRRESGGIVQPGSQRAAFAWRRWGNRGCYPRIAAG